MKRLAFLGVFLALALIVGCKSESTSTPNPSSGSSSATTEDGASSSDEDGEDATEDADGGSEGDEAAEDEAAEDGGADDDQATFELPADPLAEDAAAVEEAVEKTLDDFARDLMAAMQQRDLDKALIVTEDALVVFPDSIEMQVNRLLLRLRAGTDLEATDPAAAAAQFIDTARCARQLADTGMVPPQAERLIAMALFNEARAFAHQNQASEAVSSLQQAVAAGMTEVAGIEDDAFFATIRDNDEFKAALEEILKAVREKMMEEAREEIAQQESFEFDFELPDLDQKAVKLADFKGKLVIVDIWGTWCPPCRMEIPHFVKLQDAYANDLAIVGVNYENGEGEEMLQGIRDFMSEQGINYTCVIGDDATREQVPNFRGFPTTLFLDREGKVRLMVVGYHPYEKLQAYINVLLDETAGASSDASAS